MSAIGDVRVHPVSIPLKRPFAIAKAVHRAQTLVVVEVETSRTIGLGETQFVPGFFSCVEDAQTVTHVIRDVLAPRIAGQDVSAFRQVADRIHASTPGHPYAKAALVDAVVDAAARELGVPLFRLLGGSPGRLRVGSPIGIADIDQTLLEVAEALDAGIDEVKVKIGGRPSKEDLRVLRAIREAYGDRVTIRVDGNAGLDLADAVWLLPRISELDLQLIEEPVRQPSPFTWRRIRDLVPDVLMADESVGSLPDALGLVQAGLIDVVAIKLAKMGGLVATCDLVRYLQGARIRVFGASQPASSIGIANMAHMMCALGDFAYAGEFHMGALKNFEGDIVKASLPISNGWVEVLDKGAGNGVELDNAALRHYALGLPA